MNEMQRLTKRHLPVPRRSAITLVELLVVMAIIALLVSLLFPAVQMAREAARRVDCLNRLRQLTLGSLAYEGAMGHFPAGSTAQEYAAAPWTPHSYYRWSALAYSLPFMEGAAQYEALTLEMPLFGVDFQVTLPNREPVAVPIPQFRCPSDPNESPNPRFGPTNYAACTGSGIGGGTPFRADGVFYVNSQTRASSIEDGLSKTIAFSECVLGTTPQEESTRGDVRPEDVYGFARGIPLTEAACENTSIWNFTQPRGHSWANGEYRSALYNHHNGPNARTLDCVSAVISGPLAEIHAAYGWTAARSRHTGGVNVTMADGSGRFVENEIDAQIWTDEATRATLSASDQFR